MKATLLKMALAFLSLVLVFSAVEPFFRKNIMKIPLRAQWNLETNFRPLAQISKRDILPRDYIVILGDSNAEGMGDWYLEADQSKNSPFHSAHLLHEKTGRDVVSLGSSGAAPQRYLVANLPAFYQYINKLIGFHLEKPKDIIIYFYEGNDFNDAFRDIRKRLSPNLDSTIVMDTVRFDDYLENIVLQKDLRYKRAHHFHVIYNLQAANFVFRAVINYYKYLREGPRFSYEREPSGQNNRVRFDGVVQSVPDGMHSPGLELSEEQLRIGAFVFRQCLVRLRKAFPEARFGIVYFPAPISVYDWASPMVRIQPYEGMENNFDSGLVNLFSDKIFELIRNVAFELQIPIVDARPRLRKIATSKPVHGPCDWKHLNRTGYETLSEDVVLLLEKMQKL